MNTVKLQESLEREDLIFQRDNRYINIDNERFVNPTSKKNNIYSRDFVFN